MDQHRRDRAAILDLSAGVVTVGGGRRPVRPQHLGRDAGAAARHVSGPSAGAGGHAGAQSPLALIQEIRAWFEGSLYLSGAIARGDSILAALAMGADGGYAGSAFIATEEANAAPNYKQMIADYGAEDIVYSNLFTGVHGNYLKPSIAAAGMDPDNLEQSDPTKMNFAEDRQKPKSWKEIWGAGQGIGAVDKVVPTAELVDRLEREFLAAKARLEAQTAAYG